MTQTQKPTDGLIRGALSYREVIMQSLTNIAPAIAILFYLQLLAPLAGVAIPVVMLVAGLIMLMAAITAGQLAKKLTSAGGYYAWVTKSLNPRIGFLVGWFSFVYTPLGLAFIPVFLGQIVEDTIQTEYGWKLPWWVFFLVCLVLVTALCYRGISISGKSLLILGTIELVVVVALGLSGLFDPGPGGFNALPFEPSQLLGLHSFYLAVVYTISAYVGWEAAAPVAEESIDPERNVPRAMIAASVISIVVFVLTFWGLVVGWGTSAIASLETSSVLPPIVLAKRFWGPLWIIVLLVMFNSTLGSMISGMNVSTRMWYDMARQGVLPRQFGILHPKYKNPTVGLGVSVVIAIVLGLGLGFWIGPTTEFAFIALMGAITSTFFYVLSNIGVMRLYRGPYRNEWNFTLHLLFPVASAAALLWVLYKSVHPLPAAPVKWAPVVSLGWLVAGIAILIWMKATGKGIYQPNYAASEPLAEPSLTPEPTA